MASATDRQNFEERRQAAEGRTMKRRPQGLVTDRKVTSAVCTPAQHPDTAAEHSSATSPPPSIQTQPPTEDRQLGNEGDIPGTSSTTPTSEMPVTESSKGTCTTVLTHPFQTTRLHRSCLLCTRNREELLAQSELAQQKVRIDDWRWKVKYLSPVPEEARHTVSSDWGQIMGSWVQKPYKNVLDAVTNQIASAQIPPLTSSPYPHKVKPKGEPAHTHMTEGLDARHTKGRRKSEEGMSFETNNLKKDEWAQSRDLGNMGSRGGWPSS